MDDSNAKQTQWIYSGELAYSPGEPLPCDQCHRKASIRFKIHDIQNDKVKLVGRECINRYRVQLSKSQQSANFKDIVEATRHATLDSVKAVESAQLINSLLDLSQHSESIDFKKMLDWYEAHHAFTPKQMSLIAWQLKEHQIPHNPNAFSVTIKKHAHRDQLIQMENWKVDQIMPFLSPSQRIYFKRNYWKRKTQKGATTS